MISTSHYEPVVHRVQVCAEWEPKEQDLVYAFGSSRFRFSLLSLTVLIAECYYCVAL
jgi:hypothetical protein